MEEKKEAPLTTESQIEDWVNACRFEFRKIMADPHLQDEALKKNSSYQNKGYPLPKDLELNKDQKKLYSAAIAEASAKMMESGSFINHFSIQANALNQSDSLQDQKHGLKLSEEGRDFAKDHLFSMFDEEIRLYHSIQFEEDLDIYKTLANNPVQLGDIEDAAEEIFKHYLSNPSALAAAFDTRESIDIVGQATRTALTVDQLNIALTHIDSQDKTTYKLHDDRTGGILKLDLSIDITELKTSDILIYEAIAFSIQEALLKKLQNLTPILMSLNTNNRNPTLEQALEKQCTILTTKRESIQKLPIIKTLIEADIYSKALKKLEDTVDPNAIIIRDEIVQLYEKKDPNFSVPELTKILNSVHKKLENPSDDDNTLSNVVTKIDNIKKSIDEKIDVIDAHHIKANERIKPLWEDLQKASARYQKLKTGLIAFGAICLIIAAIGATVLSLGILSPVTFPVMIVGGALLAGITASSATMIHNERQHNQKTNEYNSKRKDILETDEIMTRPLIEEVNKLNKEAIDELKSLSTVAEKAEPGASRVSSPATTTEAESDNEEESPRLGGSTP